MAPPTESSIEQDILKGGLHRPCWSQIMFETTKIPRAGNNDGKARKIIPNTPEAQRDTQRLLVPVLSPTPIHRLSPVLDEFSLRLTPSRGGTTSPAPAKGVRKRLHQYRNFDHAVELLQRCKNIVVLTGAGISTSVGIPDFRSDKGLYQQLSKDLGITEAEEFFSKDYFVHNTGEFFHYVRRVIPEAIIGADGFFRSTNPSKATKDNHAYVPQFSPTHAFLSLLNLKRKLLTNYTQNIDGLEIAAGLPRAKFVQCHGSWDTASCLTCGRSSAAKKYLPVVFAGNIPYCKCKLDAEQKKKHKNRKGTNKQRSWDDFESDHSSDDGTKAPRGLLKPDITFFNERLSGSYNDRLDRDKQAIDLLIIIGTSLKVGPVQDMLYQISPRVPQIFISKERFSGALCNLPGVQVDIELLGECDIIIEELCHRAGWSHALQSLFWEPGQAKAKGLIGRDTSLLRKKSISDKTFEEKPVEAQDDRRALKRQKLDEIQTSAEVTKSLGDGHADLDASREARSTKNIETDSSVRPHIPNANSNAASILDAKTKSDTGVIQDQSRRQKVEDDSGTDSKLVNDRNANINQVKIELMAGTLHQWRITRK